jgi:6-phosphogluconolactonase (cycloisomerase 2 family)
MPGVQSIGLDVNQRAAEVNAGFDAVGDVVRPTLRACLGALLVTCVCACDGPSGPSTGYNNNPPPTSATLVAVTNSTTGTIDVLSIDLKTGAPTPIAGDPVPEGPTPSAVAIDPQKRFLYVTTSSGEVRGYSIDPSSLNLTAIAGSPFATSAQSVAIAVDPGGHFVLTANGSTNTVSVFKIGSTGALVEVAGSPFAAGQNASAIVVAAGKYVYAANTAGSSVSAYSMDVTSGALTPVAGTPFATGGSPNGLVVDRTATHLYAAESQPNEVSGFSINSGTGALTAIAGSPFSASYAIHSPVMDAEGKRLHVANGTDVDCFLVDATSSALTEIGLSHTNGRAVALALDGPDDLLYALDNVANQVEVFSINPTDGSLTLITGSPFALFPGAGSQSLGPNAISVQH